MLPGQRNWTGRELAEIIQGQELPNNKFVLAATQRWRRAYGGKFDDLENARYALYRAVMDIDLPEETSKTG